MRTGLILLAAMLTACGGGGGGGNFGGGNNQQGSGWQQGVFPDYNNYYARCQNPRSGIDPATQNPYPDVQGTTLNENNFLRSFSNDVYLWYSEIVDRDPGLYSSALSYFAQLKTTATTASGNPKDKFHFTYDSSEWYQLSQSGVVLGYGIQWAVFSTTPPRQFFIAYTEPGSSADTLPLPLARGAQLLNIDGADINATSSADIAKLNAGLSPSVVGEQHTLTFLDLGASSPRSVILTAQNVVTAPVQATQVISTATGEVGYVLFNDHIATAEQALIDAVNQLNAHNNGQGIDDLVLDIRYNGGGYLDIASELAYMIAGPVPTAGKDFETVQFNSKYPNTNPLTGGSIIPTPFHSSTLGSPFNGNGGVAGQALPNLGLSRVFVLTGGGTCSASEAIINGLRGVGVEVIQIGSTTCGKPYGFYPIDNCGTTYFTIQFRGVNDMNFGDYTDGFSPQNTAPASAGTTIPGCSVADDFNAQLGDPSEGRLATALAYRDGQACPAATGSAPGVLAKSGTPDSVEPVIPKSPWLTNRIMRPTE